jgi:hypothetical protein
MSPHNAYAKWSARRGSSNDASLACLAWALREWAATQWPRDNSRPLSTAVMMDGRRPEETSQPGNFFACAPIALPCHLPTLDKQLAAVVAATRYLKQPSMRHALRTLMERTPARAYYAAVQKATPPSGQRWIPHT